MSFEPATAATSGPMLLNFSSTPDPATHLPAGVPADRYAALILRTEDLHRLLPDSSVRLQVGADRLAAERRLQQLTTPRPVGHGLEDDDHRVVVTRKELATLSAQQKKLTELDATRSKAWQTTGWLLSNVNAWLKAGRPGNTIMETIKVPVPKLLKGETIAAAIDRLGQQAKELRTKLAEIERAPLPSAFVRARLREQLAVLAARGEINIDRLLQSEDGQIAFPETQVTLKVYSNEPGAIAIGTMPDIVGMLVYANHDSLLATLVSKLAGASAASDARALLPEQKQKQSAQVMSELFAVEVDEATLTFQAWQDGLPVEADPGIQPAALLAVRNVVAPVDPNPRTSPEHVRVTVGLR